ncbi:MFS transporter [Paenibacillus psychroresistens]|nr:MFS transporter [Paenibacillus psychroresistens]
MSINLNSTMLKQQAVKADDRPNSLILLTVLLLSVFMAVVNVFIVNVATPSIQRGLQSSFSSLQFVVAGYTLSYAVALIIGGRLGDRFGRKKILFIGMAGFTLTSLICGLAVDVNMLIVFRILQGLSAAMIAPQVLSLIQVNYAAEKRGAIFGMYGAAQGIAATTGQVIGGVLMRWNPWGLEWRMVFFFSVAVGILIMLLIPFINESKSSEHAKLDWIGAFSVAGGLLMLIYPLVQGQKEGWPLSLNLVLILSLPVLIGFVWYEKRVTRKGGVPFMNVQLFQQKLFTVGMLIAILLYSAQGAFFLIMAYFLQIGLGFAALKAGLVILPMGIGYFLASLYTAKAIARFGAYTLTIGSILTFAGYIALALSVKATGIDFAGYEWIPALFLLGVGQGMIAAPLTNSVLSKIRGTDVGSASGILTTGIQTSYALGIVLIGVLLLNSMGSHTAAVNGKIAPMLQQSLSVIQVKADESSLVLQQFNNSDYVQANDPSSLPKSCAVNYDSPEVKNLFNQSLKMANAENYADSFQICLYALAIVTLGIFPLSLMLARRKRAIV